LHTRYLNFILATLIHKIYSMKNSKNSKKLSLNKKTIQEMERFSDPSVADVRGGRTICDIPTIDIPSPNDHSCIICVPGCSCSTHDTFTWGAVADGGGGDVADGAVRG
jgi:hypothetical protein